MSKTRKPFVDFRAIRGRITMEQVLEHYGVLHTLKRTGSRLSGPCPIHNGTNPTQFRVETDRNIWNCFSECKHGGNTLDFIAKKEDCSVHEAALKACEWFNIPVSEVTADAASAQEPEEEPAAASKSSSKPKAALTAPSKTEDNAPNPPLKFQLKNLQHEHPYLKERGISLETAIDFGIGFFAGEKGLMVGRVAIPIHNVGGELVAYAGRWAGTAPNAETEKYRLPPNFKKSQELFNLDRAAKESTQKPLVIVEGFFDAIKLHQNGWRKVVAVMGSKISDAQIELVRRHGGANGRVIVMFDEDDAGREGREDAAAGLAKFCFVKTHVFDKPDMQPEHLSVAEIHQILGGAL
jgi:DNA primase